MKSHLDFVLTLTGTKLQRLSGHIEFLDVSFSYPSRPTVNFFLVVTSICHFFQHSGFL